MNVKRFSVWVALLAVEVAAQPYAVGIRRQGMAGAGVAGGRDAEVLFANPALLTQLHQFSTAICYSHPFGLPDLHLASVAVAGSFAGLACGAGAIHFGDNTYHDQHVYLALAKGFGKSSPSAAAFSLAMRRLFIEGYGTATTFGVNLGTTFSLAPAIRAGVFLCNLNRPSLGEANEKLPLSASAGIACALRSNWLLQVDIYREFGFAEELRAGVEVRALSKLLLRLGVATHPDRISAGFALELGQANVEMAATSHSDLGITQMYAIVLGEKGNGGRRK